MIKGLILSFKYASSGFVHALRTEKNFRLECAAVILSVILGTLFKLSKIEWLVLIVFIPLLLAAELFNTAFEYLCNRVTQEIDPAIKACKDISAAAVMMVTLVSLVCWGLIFIPHLVKWIGG